MIDITALFRKKLGESMDEYLMPPPSFSIMQCEIIEFNEEKKSIDAIVFFMDNLYTYTIFLRYIKSK